MDKKVDGKLQEVPNTYENISEKLAELIAKRIGIKSAHIDIGTYNGAVGCFSYNLKGNTDMMNEGIDFITKKFPNYNPETGIDSKTKEYYSFDMIMQSLENESLKRQFLEVIIFDYIIGNTDRHQNNWAVLKNEYGESNIVLYDNRFIIVCICSRE